MWSFSTFKDKRYWILLILFIIILVILMVFKPDHFFEKNYVSPFIILIFPTSFWSIYHIWKYFGDKKKNITDDSSDL